MGAALETTVQDIRYGCRALKKSPGFTFFAVLTIALALGANAAIFSLVDGVLLKSSGYANPERIVQLWEKPPNGTRNGISAANYLDWAKQAQSFDAMAARTTATMAYTGGGEPKSIGVGTVSPPYFDVLGVKPALGRTFAKGEDQAGSEKVAVLTNRLWRSLFGSDPTLIGRTILLDGSPYTVIGVMPGAGELDRQPLDLWIPLTFAAQPARNYHYLGAVARLKPGVSIEQGQAEMSSIAGGIAKLYPDIKKDWGATVDRYIDRIVSPQLRLSLTVLMWAVAAVLMIGCANLANLLMARATLRSREIALRMAVGASRGRVIRMLLTESLVLSVAGATVGMGLGYGLLKWIQSLLPPFYLPAEANVAMDQRVLVFLAAVTLLTSIAFGLAPAIQASRRDSAEALAEGGRGNSSSRRKLYLRHAFVAFQVAAAFILLVGAGLLIRSFVRLMNVDTGFETEGVIAAYLPTPMERNPEIPGFTQYVYRILETVNAVPGVREAAVASAIPLRGWGNGMPMRLADKPDEPAGTGFKVVTPGYFSALQLRLVEGRYLNERDTAGSPHVIVVNESFVRRYFPNQSAIGKRVLIEKILPDRRGRGPRTNWEIVGVVADEKGSGLESPTDIGSYASFAQNPIVGLGIVVKGDGEGGALIKSVQQAVWSVNKDQVLDRPQTVEQLKTASMSPRRLTSSLLSGFALLAMLLACAGIYGVLSFVTARRSQEMGIRVAMGASRTDLIRLVIGGGAIPVLVGIVAGLGGSMALARFMESILFATKPIDALTLVGVSALLFTVALAACFVPAWRAAKVDPMTTLRQE
jgi:putative ABC transport system permease protein